MGFVGRPNKALANMGLKDQNWSHFWKESKPWRKREEERRRGEEEEEGEKFKQSSIKVWNFGFLYGNYFEYGSNLGYELYYESHGFCMGF